MPVVDRSESPESPVPSPAPGDRRAAPPARAPLTRPPGERYRGPDEIDGAPETAVTPPFSGLAVAAITGLAGSALTVVLGGVLSLSTGLLVVAGGVGWIIGRSVGTAASLPVGARRAIALGLALESVVVGQLGLWLYALSEGGVLGPLEYVGQTWGPLVLVQLAVAGVTAGWASR